MGMCEQERQGHDNNYITASSSHVNLIIPSIHCLYYMIMSVITCRLVAPLPQTPVANGFLPTTVHRVKAHQTPSRVSACTFGMSSRIAWAISLLPVRRAISSGISRPHLCMKTAWCLDTSYTSVSISSLIPASSNREPNLGTYVGFSRVSSPCETCKSLTVASALTSALTFSTRKDAISGSPYCS